MNYSIHSAASGETLIKEINLDQADIENLSSDNAEGFFKASQVTELESLGDVTVYAIVR